MHRLRGDLAHAEDGSATQEAEQQFQRALTRGRQSRSLELRAAAVISAGGRKAHNSLAPIYGWFTEGFDTADPQEACAKRLL